MNFTSAERIKLTNDIEKKLKMAKAAMIAEMGRDAYEPGVLSKIHTDIAMLMQHQQALSMSNNLVLPPMKPNLAIVKGPSDVR
jgi:hypothetical protein